MKMTTAMTAIASRRSPIKQVREKPQAPVLNPPPMPPAMAKPCPRRCVSGAAGCWATAPVAARAARSLPSSSITGCAAAAGRYGLSASDKLLEDARPRLGRRSAGPKPTSSHCGKFRQGADIPQEAGILFATYATLRSPARQGKRSRPRTDRRLARGWHGRRLPPCLWRRHRVRRGSRHGQRRRVQGITRRYGPLAAGPCRIAFAERSARCPYTLCLRHRGHHGAWLGLCAPPRAVGRRGFRRRDALRATHRLRHRHGGRRGRGDGGGGPRSEGPRALPGPCAQL